MQMLWRLNFLVIFLCLSQGTTYILYYICLLHTYFFLMVYVAMRVYKNVNYTAWGLRVKMMVLAVIIFVVWDLDSGIFRLVHWPFLGTQPMLGATSGAMWEWYFRSSLDHWSTFLGMTFALNFPITSLFFRKLEAQPLVKHVIAKTAMGLVLGGAAVWWVIGPFQHGKFQYNQTNAYLAWIPLYAYIYFRNITPWLRNHTLELLHQIGKTTLETYLMQHHIWLTSDAKSLLILIPGWPKMNFLLVTTIYFMLSRRLYQLTLFLRGMILPNDRTACIQNLIMLVVSVVICLVIAFGLQLVGMLNMMTVGICALAFGFGLYQVILVATSSSTSSSGSGFEDSPLAYACISHSVAQNSACRVFRRFLSPITGAAVVVACGAVWHHAATTGAAKIQPLPATCNAYIHNGGWIPNIDSCNDVSSGALYREHGIGSLGTCLPQTTTYNWGWEAAPSSSLCRFQQRPTASLLKAFKHRRIVFVGDSVMRNLFFSLCRQLGDSGAGAYNTTIQKWSDFSRTYGKAGDVMLDFKWAPYSDDLVGALQNITAISSKAEQWPDLVVAGGGPWDRLHRYTDESEREKRKQELVQLAKALQALGSKSVPLVWTVPTTINSWALMTEEKRLNIPEEEMVAVRELYKEQGILESVDFVLDGPSFTVDRVAESHDGVHYPLDVYDAGAQILCNAMDWLLKDTGIVEPFVAPRPGAMAHPLFGLMMLAVVFVAIFFMDAFFGASYLAGLVVPSVRPSALLQESFNALHSQMKLPPINFSRSDSSPSVITKSTVSDDGDAEEIRSVGGGSVSMRSKGKDSEREEDDEIEHLLGDHSVEGQK